MAKVIIFSEVFPVYHDRSGEHTYFRNLYLNGYKKTTLRRGYRWKVGDSFSPRVWTSKPYQSKQEVIGPDGIIKDIKDVYINFQLDTPIVRVDGKVLNVDQWVKLSLNDGLIPEDFRSWFNEPFEGQMLCFVENINY